MPGQAGDQRVLGAPGHIPLGEQVRDERVGDQALADRLRRTRRGHRRRDPAPARPPVPAAAVRGHPHDHHPVQHLGDVIPQPARTASRTAGSSTRRRGSPRPPPPAAGASNPAGPPALPAPASRSSRRQRADPSSPRRHRRRRLSRAGPVPRTGRTASASAPPARRSPAPSSPSRTASSSREPGDLLPLPLHQRRQPLVRLQRLRQRTLQARERIRFRECTASSHEPQQTPAHTGNHARPRPACHTAGRRTPSQAPATRLPTTYILIGTPRGSRPTYRHYPDRSRPLFLPTLLDLHEDTGYCAEDCGECHDDGLR